MNEEAQVHLARATDALSKNIFDVSYAEVARAWHLAVQEIFVPNLIGVSNLHMYRGGEPRMSNEEIGRQLENLMTVT
jgi:hypothetical protein